MPKFRQLHTQIVNSFDFAEMPGDFARVLWLMLIVIVDSEGRGIDNPAWIRSMAFPLRQDVEIEQIEAAMTWFNERGLINRYQVCGRDYFELAKFHTYQSGTDKEAPSKLPANPEQLPEQTEPTPELLQSYSRVTPELVPSRSASTSTSTSTAITNTTIDDEEEEATRKIYSIYTSEIGLLTPSIADEIGSAMGDYPQEWIIEAIREAARQNARSWKYISAILRRWKAEGFQSISAKVAKRNGKPSAGAEAAKKLAERYGLKNE